MSLHDQYSLPKEAPLYLLAGTSLLTLIISIISLYSGITIVFQNLLYIPIIIACAFYLKRGFFYSLFLVGLYGILMCVITGSEEEHIQILLRMGIFILVAGIITYLSQLRLQTTIQYIKSEQKYRHLFLENEAGTALHEIICDESGNPVDYRFLEVNPAFEKMTGLRAADIIGKTVLEVMPGTEPSWIQTYGRVAQSQESIHFEDYSRELERYYAVTAYSPEIGKFATIVIDTTDRKKQEIEITETNEYLENLITYANVPIIVWNPDLVIIRVNHAFEELVGLAQTDLVGQSLYHIFSPEHFDQSIRLISSTQKGARWETVEIPILHSDGSVRTVLWNSSTIYTPDKSTPVATIAQGRDVTVEQMLELEREGAAAQIQENIAKLSILNDEIRNPLTIIAIYAEMVDDSSIHENIKTAIARIDEMVKDLDTAWLNSKKILNYLQKHDNISFDFLQPGHTHAEGGIKGRIITLAGPGITSSSIGSHERFIEEIQKRLYQILDSIDAFVYVTDMETYDVLYLNEQARTIYGKNIGKKCYEKIHPEEKGPCSFCTNNLVLSDSKPTGVIQWEWHDAEHGRWYDCRDRAIPWTDGRLVKLEIATDITGRKLADAALRESETKYRSLFDNAILGVYRTSPEGQYLDMNPAFARIAGYESPEEMMAVIDDIGNQLYVHPQDRKKIGELLEKYGEVRNYEAEVRHRDGHSIWIAINTTGIRDNEGKILAWEGTIDDITARKIAEHELARTNEELHAAYEEMAATSEELRHNNDELVAIQKSLRKEQERLEGILKGTNAGTWEWDVQTGEVIVNERWAEIIGYTLEEISPVSIESWEKFCHPLDLNVSEDLLDRHFQGELDYYECEARMLHKSGEWVWVLDRGRVVTRTQDGRPLMMMGTHQEITDRKEAEESLREFKTAVMQSVDGIALADMAGHIRFVNRAFAEMHGYSSEELIGQHLNVLHTREQAEHEVAPFIEQLIASGSSAEGEIGHVRKDGTEFPTYMSTTVLKGADGTPIGLLRIARDITEQKRAEEQTRLLAEISANMFDSILVTDAQFRITYVNKNTEELFGYTPRELLGRTPDIFLADTADPEKQRELYEAVSAGTIYAGEAPNRRKDGTTFICEYRVMPMPDKDGNIVAYIGIQRDITDRKQAFEALQASEERYRGLFSSMSSGVVVYTPVHNGEDFIITDFNPAAEKIEQIPRESVIGRSVKVVFPGVVDFGIFSVFVRVAKTGIPEHFPVAMYSDERIQGWRDNFVFRLSSGEVVSVYEDSTERKRAEEALLQSEEKYRSIFENAVFGIFQTAPDGTLLNANNAFARMYGYPDVGRILASGINVGRDLYERPQDRAEVIAIINEKGIMEPREYPVLDKDRNRFWISVTARVVRASDGTVLYYEGICIDITGRKQAEEELLNRVRREADIINFLPDPTFAIDTNGIVIAWNRAMETMTGIAAADMLGKGNYEYSLPIYHERRPILIDLVLSYDQETAGLYLNITRTGNQIIAEKVASLSKDDSDSYIWMIASPLYDRSGMITGAIESIRDITSIKETESAFKRSEELYRSILENIQEVFYRTDREGRLIMASPSWASLFGYDNSSECIGMDIAETFYYEPGRRKEFLETIAANGYVENYVAQLKRKDGTPLWVSTNSHYYYDKSGRIEGIEGILRDITEIREAEESIRESEKRYRTLFETTGTAMVVLENDGTISLANIAFERLSGYRKVEIENTMKWMDFVVPDDLERMQAQHRLRREDPESSHAHYEFRFKARSGDIHHIYLSASLIPQTLKSFASLLDITSRIQAEETLQKKHEELEATYEELAHTEQELKKSYDELVQSREALIRSEGSIRKKLENLLSPDGDIGMLNLEDLLDIPALQALMEDFTRVSGMGMAILDVTGKVLVATGWQDICTRFHRVHQVTAGYCTESDLHLAANLKEGQYTAYKCKNNLWDVVTPLFVGEQHMGNVFTGQFFYDDDIIDESVFIEQARVYGFDRDEYLAALHRVPRFSHERVHALMDYLIRLTRFLSLLSYGMLSLARTANQRDTLIRSLETSEEKYRGIFENALIGIFQTAPDGTLQNSNDALARMFGYADADEILSAGIDVGRDLYERVEDRREVLALLREHEFMEPREYPARDKDKNRFWISITARTIRDEDGTIIGIEGFCIDVTDRKRAEEELQESEELFRTVMNQLPGTVWAVDRTLTYTTSQGRGLAAIGLQPDQVRGMTLYEFFGTDDPDHPVISQHMRALAGETVMYEYTHDGITFQTFLSPLHDPAGAIIGVTGIAVDITQLKATEEALAKSQERFRMLAENSRDVIYHIDLIPERNIRYLSPSVEALCGYSPEELYQDFDILFAMVHPDDRSQLLDLLDGVIPMNWLLTISWITRDGERIWTEHTNVLIHNDEGQLVAIQGNARDITWRREAEEQIKRSEEKFSAVFAISPDPMAITDIQTGAIIDANPVFCEWMGYPLDELIGKKTTELDIWINPREREEIVSQVKRDSEVINKEVSLRIKDGKVHECTFSARFITLRGKKLLFTQAHDVSDMYILQRHLKESEAHLAQAQEIAHLGSWTYNPETREITWTLETFQIFGRAPDLGEPDFEELVSQIHPSNREDFIATVKRTLQDRTAFEKEWNIMLPSGEIRVIKTVGQVTSSDETITGLIGTVLDITDQSRAEEALQESREMYRQLFEAESDAILLVDNATGDIMQANESATDMYGYSREELLMMRNTDLSVEPEKTEQFTKQTPVNADVVIAIPLRWHRKKDGALFPVEITARFFEFSGRSVHLAAIRDITTRLQLEQQLQESRDLLIATENLAQVGGFEYDVSEQMLTWTDETYRIHGLDPGAAAPGSTDLISTSLSCYDPDDRPVIEAAFYQCIREGIPYKLEFPLTTYQGNRIWIQTTARPIEEDGEIKRIIGNILDITERKHTEEALLQVNKKLDLLTNITRHDINNTLTILSGSVEIAEMRYPDPVVLEYFLSMKKAIKTMISQIEFTQMYQNLGTGKPGWHRIQDILPASHLPSTIQMTLDIPNIELYADPMLERVFFTLLDNTLRHGKNVTEIRVSCIRIPEGIVVSWEDDGAGIPGQEKEKIFEQGYGKNTGLGLYLTRDILGITDITIRETGEPGKGARFEMTVPDGRWRIKRE